MIRALKSPRDFPSSTKNWLSKGGGVKKGREKERSNRRGENPNFHECPSHTRKGKTQFKGC